jgi:hypothetical protein
VEVGGGGEGVAEEEDRDSLLPLTCISTTTATMGTPRRTSVTTKGRDKAMEASKHKGNRDTTTR